VLLPEALLCSVCLFLNPKHSSNLHCSDTRPVRSHVRGKNTLHTFVLFSSLTLRENQAVRTMRTGKPERLCPSASREGRLAVPCPAADPQRAPVARFLLLPGHLVGTNPATSLQPHRLKSTCSSLQLPAHNSS